MARNERRHRHLVLFRKELDPVAASTVCPWRCVPWQNAGLKRLAGNHADLRLEQVPTRVLVDRGGRSGPADAGQSRKDCKGGRNGCLVIAGWRKKQCALRFLDTYGFRRLYRLQTDGCGRH